jgi:hypothetical protein
MENQACSFGIELARLVLPASLVIVGWIVVNHLAVKREMDKSRREMIAKSADGLCETVDTLFEDANEYHSSARDQKLEVKIKITLSDISQRIGSLRQITQDTCQLTHCLTSVVKLRQSVTGKHFEDEHNEPLSNGSIHEEIADASLAMKRSLVELKHSQFPLPTVYR